MMMEAIERWRMNESTNIENQKKRKKKKNNQKQMRVPNTQTHDDIVSFIYFTICSVHFNQNEMDRIWIHAPAMYIRINDEYTTARIHA